MPRSRAYSKRVYFGLTCKNKTRLKGLAKDKWSSLIGLCQCRRKSLITFFVNVMNILASTKNKLARLSTASSFCIVLHMRVSMGARGTVKANHGWTSWCQFHQHLWYHSRVAFAHVMLDVFNGNNISQNAPEYDTWCNIQEPFSKKCWWNSATTFVPFTLCCHLSNCANWLVKLTLDLCCYRFDEENNFMASKPGARSFAAEFRRPEQIQGPTWRNPCRPNR